MEKKILIAEDERPIAQAMKLKLEAEGFQADVAANGKEAIEMLEKEKYSLMLLDLVMPILDGFGTLEALKGKSGVPPIIVSTNLSQPEDEQRTKELGAKEFIVKSNTPINELIKLVKQHLA